MNPVWVGVVTALSLAIIAIAVVAVAIAGTMAALAIRRLIRTIDQLAGPALSDVRQLVGSIKNEAEALVGTSKDIRGRIVRAADAAESRLTDLDALAEVVSNEVEETALAASETMQQIREGFSLIKLGRQLFGSRKKKRRR